MIISEYYATREDGVNLYKTYDAVSDVDEAYNTINVPSGYKIQKVGTDEFYDEAIDVEDALFVYIKSDKKIEEEIVEEKQEISEENI